MKSIILAGGSGSRLWPLSNDEYPKQLLPINSDKSLLQQTFMRVCNLVNPNDIVSVTNITHYNQIKAQLDAIMNNSIVFVEPIAKNTAPAIAYALKTLEQTTDSDEIVLIVPSDHLINDNEKFREAVNNGKILAEQNYIVTFGVKPTYPETGYGYIKVGNEHLSGFCVDKFVEKPDLNMAEKYLSDGNYYWNSGIFMGKISVLLSEFKKYAPQIYNHLNNIDNFQQDINSEIYAQMPSISIDYAIMEKSDRVALVRLLSDWNDLGSWQALYDIGEKDNNNNVLSKNVITHNVTNSYISSNKKVIAVTDIDNIVLVETEDSIMLCKLDKSQNVKLLYDKLKYSES